MKKLLLMLLLATTANASTDPYVNEMMEQVYKRDHERQQGDYYAKINLCSQIKELLVADFNSEPKQEADYGHLIRVDDITTDSVIVSDGIPIVATCKGNFVFKGGKIISMGYGFSL